MRCLESLHAFVCRCTEELIWLNERKEEELAYDWSHNNTNVNAKRDLYAVSGHHTHTHTHKIIQFFWYRLTQIFPWVLF